MKIYRINGGFVVEQGSSFYQFKNPSTWDEIINRDDLYDYLDQLISTEAKGGNDFHPLAPIGSQEVWAAGVTYFSSRLARMEESKDAGGGDFYSRVYGADRPEIFFKATAARTVGPGENFRIRKDSTWDVPEPELTLCVTSSGKIVGYTIGNDVSSRSIEGENPLYLPQAKTFDGCACLGPCIYVTKEPLAEDTSISMKISRGSEVVFEGETTLREMKRKPQELVDYLLRETSFPQGVFLMTGTGIVPSTDFTLRVGDIVDISIDSIGTLTNAVGA
jgi:2-dehydro-3-deoxy-D-arabinonate dehydratase